MNEMTLPSRHKIRHSSPGGLRSSTLPFCHGGSPQYSIFTSKREETFYFFETWRPEWGSTPRSTTFQAGSCNHCTMSPPRWNTNCDNQWKTKQNTVNVNLANPRSCNNVGFTLSQIEDWLIVNPALAQRLVFSLLIYCYGIQSIT